MPATPAPATSSAALRAALLHVPPVAVGSVPDLGRAVFVGSGTPWPPG